MHEENMNAKEARKQSLANKSVIDKITEQRVRDHILDAVRNGKFKASVCYYIPTYFIKELEEEGYTVSTLFESTIISW